jgi:hypothetical protein
VSRNWTREELAEALARNPGLRVATEPLDRVANRQPPKVAAKPDFGRAPGNGLRELMGAPDCQGQLGPEDHLSYAVACELRRLSVQGRLRAVWFGIPIQHPAGGKYAMLAQAKRTALGAVPGCPDFGVMWGTGAGFIELKVDDPQGRLLATDAGLTGWRKGRRTYLRGRQRLFQAWAQAHGVRHAVARSVAEVVAVLKGWGVLT